MIASNSFLTKLIGHYNKLEITRKKVEKLYLNKELSLQDIEVIYKGLFIEILASFENFIENIFVGLLSNNTSLKSKKIKPKIVFNSSKICRAILAGDRSYVDWLPYDRYTMKRAKIFFKNGYPFTLLSKSERDVLEKSSIIRNAIAHKSIYSIKKFKEEFINGKNLLPKESTVVGFLRSNYRSNPSQIWYEYFMIETASVAKSLCSKM